MWYICEYVYPQRVIFPKEKKSLSENLLVLMEF